MKKTRLNECIKSANHIDWRIFLENVLQNFDF